MARVDFYVLSAAGEQARLRFACRLAEKAYKLDNKVQVLAADHRLAEQFDELLWTWRDGSFVPHGLAGRDSTTRAPIVIGCDTELPPGDFDLLINLSDRIPTDVDAFPRVAEIVTSDEDTRQRSRAHYASYRDQGHTLETHKL